jgi:hypothetical protein
MLALNEQHRRRDLRQVLAAETIGLAGRMQGYPNSTKPASAPAPAAATCEAMRPPIDLPPIASAFPADGG